MTYRLARSLEVLRAEVNAYAPNRSKVSDGWIGDAAHASRGSDHNPWVVDGAGVGVVRAFDFTHDPSGGLDCDVLAERIRALGGSGDRRLADGGYVIWRSRIASGYAGNWAWRPYSGSNPHERHVHVSVSREQSAYDAANPWQVTGARLQYEPTPTTPEDDVPLNLADLTAVRQIVQETFTAPTADSPARARLRADILEQVNKSRAAVLGELGGLKAAVRGLADAQGVDGAALIAAVERGASEAVRDALTGTEVEATVKLGGQ